MFRSRQSKEELPVTDILSALADNKIGVRIQTKGGTYLFQARYRKDV